MSTGGGAGARSGRDPTHARADVGAPVGVPPPPAPPRGARHRGDPSSDSSSAGSDKSSVPLPKDADAAPGLGVEADAGVRDDDEEEPGVLLDARDARSAMSSTSSSDSGLRTPARAMASRTAPADAAMTAQICAHRRGAATPTPHRPPAPVTRCP